VSVIQIKLNYHRAKYFMWICWRLNYRSYDVLWCYLSHR